MSIGALALFGYVFGLIAALPAIFFRKGVFNVLWLATGAPYFVCALSLLASHLGYMPALPGWPQIAALAQAQEAVGVLLGGVSATLMGFVLGTHQKPLRLWHQKDDKTEHLVTHGAYSRIRHPFYTSFLTALTGAFIFAPSYGTAATLLYGAVVMTLTAKKEEAGILASEFGKEYAAYMQRTGRFFPYLGAQPAPAGGAASPLADTKDA